MVAPLTTQVSTEALPEFILMGFAVKAEITGGPAGAGVGVGVQPPSWPAAGEAQAIGVGVGVIATGFIE